MNQPQPFHFAGKQLLFPLSLLIATVAFESIKAQSLPPSLGVMETESMSECRLAFGLANVGEGMVLAAGGQTSGDVTASAEMFHLTGTEQWSAVSAMSVPRTSFQLVSLPGGGAIAVGGWDGDVTNHASTELFGMATEQWIEGPSLSVGRSNLRSTVLPNGKILFTGGFDGFVDVAACDLYDPMTNTMETVADMNFGRSSHVTILLPDGKVMVAGGFNPDFGFQMVECEIYDPSTNTWTMTAPLNSGRDNFAGLLTSEGVPMVIGGRFFDSSLNHFVGQNTGEYYDFSNQQWETFNLPGPQSYQLIVPVGDNSEYPHTTAGVDHTGFGIPTTYTMGIWFSGGVDWSEFLLNINPAPRYQAAIAPVYPGSSNQYLVAGGDPDCFGTAELWDWSTSVGEIASPSFSIFPNPVVDYGFISGLKGPLQWQVRSTSGGQLRSGTGEKVDFRGMSPGLYFLTIRNSEGTFSGQVLVR